MRASNRSWPPPRRFTRGTPAAKFLTITAAIGLLAILGFVRQQTPGAHVTGEVANTIAASSIASSAGQSRTHPTGFFNGWFVSPKVGWAVMTSGVGGAALGRTIDGGIHWTPQLTLEYPHLLQRDMSFLDQNNGFVAVGVPTNGHLESRLMATTDGGDHWTARSLPAGLVSGLDFVSPTRGWALTSQAATMAVYRTDDGGATWQNCASPAGSSGDRALVHLEGVRFSNGQLGWVAGWVSSMAEVSVLYLVTNDGCKSWQTSWSGVGKQSSGNLEVMYVDLPQAVGGRFASAVVTRELNTGVYQLWRISSPTGLSQWKPDRTPDRSRTLPAWSPVGHSHSAIITNGTVSAGLPSAPTLGASSAVMAIQFVDSSTGFAEVAVATSTRLMATHDGGTTWGLVSEGN